MMYGVPAALAAPVPPLTGYQAGDMGARSRESLERVFMERHMSAAMSPSSEPRVVPLRVVEPEAE